MTLAAILGIVLPILKVVAPALASFLVGWLLPSPIQKAEKGQADVHNAEKKATDSRGDVTDLDSLP